MADFAPCPYCGFRIPEFSSVCGHCQREVRWHGGWPYSPEVAEQKRVYSSLIWSGWPWKTNIFITVALLGARLMVDPPLDMPRDPIEVVSAIIVVLMLGALIGLPIYVYRWLYVRAKYPQN